MYFWSGPSVIWPVCTLASPDSPLGSSHPESLAAPYLTTILIVLRIYTCGSSGLKHLSSPDLLSPDNSYSAFLCLVRVCLWLGYYPGDHDRSNCDLLQWPCNSHWPVFSACQLPKDKDWAFLDHGSISIAWPRVNSQELFTERLHDTDLAGLIQANKLYESLVLSTDPFVFTLNSWSEAQCTSKLTECGEGPQDRYGPHSPLPLPSLCQEWDSEKPNTNPKPHSNEHYRMLQFWWPHTGYCWVLSVWSFQFVLLIKQISFKWLGASLALQVLKYTYSKPQSGEGMRALPEFCHLQDQNIRQIEMHHFWPWPIWYRPSQWLMVVY